MGSLDDSLKLKKENLGQLDEFSKASMEQLG